MWNSSNLANFIEMSANMYDVKLVDYESIYQVNLYVKSNLVILA
jgi:hypothetical protein